MSLDLPRAHRVRFDNRYLVIDGRRAVLDDIEDGTCHLFIAPDTPDAERWQHGKWLGQFTVVDATREDLGSRMRVYEFVECEVPKPFRDACRAAFTWVRVTDREKLPPSLRGEDCG